MTFTSLTHFKLQLFSIYIVTNNTQTYHLDATIVPIANTIEIPTLCPNIT